MKQYRILTVYQGRLNMIKECLQCRLHTTFY